MKTDIILAGVGGQGILSIATILGAAALNTGLYLKQAEVHGMSQRGGDVQSNLRLSSDPIHSDLIGLGCADMIVSLEPMEALRYMPFLKNDGVIITSTVPFKNIPNYPEEEKLMAELSHHDRLVAFDMDEAARQIGNIRVSNMVLLGAASHYISILPDEIEAAIRQIFNSKGEKIAEMNVNAFRLGRDLSVNSDK